MILERLLENLPHLLAILALTAASGFFSAGETALFSLTRQQLALLRQSHGMAAQAILKLRESPASLLSTLLLGNTIVNILLFTVLALTCNRLGGGSPAWSALFGTIGFAFVILGAEILPKLMAFSAAARFAPLAAPPLRLFQWVMTPIRWAIDSLVVEPLTRIINPESSRDETIASEELLRLVSQSRTQGLIDERETVMLHRLVNLSDARVANLMVPRVDVVAFDLSEDRAKLVSLIMSSRFLRIPVYEGSIDNARGVVHAKEVLAHPDTPVADLIRPVHFIPEQAAVEDLLRHFRATASQSALVVDEYGGLAGVVSLEDVVEEIVGELYAPDEVAPRQPIHHIDDKTFLVDADLDLDEFRRAFLLELEESRFNTVGGLIAERLNRVPQRGDHVELGTAKLTVLLMRRRRIIQTRLELAEPVAPNPDLDRLLQPTSPFHAGSSDGGGAS
jgi:putative hemolysin